MKYFVIKNRQTNKVTAVVFHDTNAVSYVVRSKSEAFRRAFEASVKSLNDSKFAKKGNKLRIYRIGLETEYWSKAVLAKTCGSHWQVVLSKEMSFDDNMEDLISKHLS